MPKPKLIFGSPALSRRASIVQQDAIGSSSRFLSSFQIEKLTWYFDTFFDLEKDGKIEAIDIQKLNERMREYAGWNEHSDGYQQVCDLHRNFLECLLDQVQQEQDVFSDLPVEKVDYVTLSQWLNMWGRLSREATSISDFPYWCQLLPQLLFKLIDRDKDGIINQDELREFYRSFIGIAEDQLEEITKEGYRAMTANGDYQLTLEIYDMSFSNFLLGRTIYGPGKYIFGCFDNREMKEGFKIIYSTSDDEEK